MKPRNLVIIVGTSAALSAVGLVAGRAAFSDRKADKLSTQAPPESKERSNDREQPVPEAQRVPGARRASPSAVEVTTEPEALEPAEPEADAATARDSSESQEEDSAEPSFTTEDVRAFLDTTFETETTDKQWGASATQAIYDVAQPELGPNSEIRSVECRSSLCRIESVQEDSEHYAAFVSKVKQSKVSPEGFFTKTGETPDGKSILTMYLAREGHPLPHLE